MTTHSLAESSADPHAPIASAWHTLIVVAFGALNAYRGAIHASQTRAGLGLTRPWMYLRTMFFEFLFLAVVAVGVRLRHGSLQPIFGQRWRSASQAFRELGLGIALLVVSTVVVSILGGHQTGAQANQSIVYLLPQNSLELLLWMALSLTAGICEEAIYRGYFQRQFTAFTHSVPAGILISAAAFGAAHAYQGFQRALVIAISATLFGLVAQWKATVRPGMSAHTLQDAVAPFLIKLTRP